ncbi:signal peptidase I [Corynebacterium sp. CCM 8835]|uniref:signal peptidase I n=1 Tax=Corynebacterium antarcticum TaxID=2800405 RepID=UPI002003AF04|nr:signal peptidase I [Corynebacterium antarcticum]MCK7641698.1 signal peptidase I [Corynebacterium antarcticum]MCK7660206.1 signal peptidase I [Corynebacterium antarcticum]MCL0244926.1 signal peptidase I [Corynebacterium antarcticum]MCX7491300.1 signal peptidase I [Corynebacterium antarcticum]MCX7539520.1 signal peptidase I [Corynebacterium antarcticum]
MNEPTNPTPAADRTPHEIEETEVRDHTEDAADPADEPRGQKKNAYPWYVEIPVVVVLTLVVVAIMQLFVGRIYLIPSQSMEPTLHGCEGCTGDRIAVDKLTYRFSDPKPGDVVVFKGTDSWNSQFTTHRSENPAIRGLQNLGSYVGLVAPDENTLVKRIIATGGQTIECQAGDPGVMVDGKKVDDSFIQRPPTYPIDERTGSVECGGAFFGPITVPAGNIFVMGDNRTNSADSRYHLGDQFQGTIPEENIRGKVQAIILPISRIGLVDDPDIQN